MRGFLDPVKMSLRNKLILARECHTQENTIFLMLMEILELWKATLGELELTISKPSFTTWFKQTKLLEISDERAVISVPNTFTQRFLEHKYNPAIIKSLQNVSGQKIKEVTYKTHTSSMLNTLDLSSKDVSSVLASSFIDNTASMNTLPIDAHGLNPRYTFENFVVGKANESAFAAAQAVVANPGVTYNPLFIYGSTGLGKTHLLQAVGHYLLKKNPDLNIIYVTCENFVNDFVSYLQTGRAKEFKDRYRNVDLFLVDDVQFFIGKAGSIEEFFNTFNELHQHNKQMVFTCDRQPDAIPTIEPRMISRFKSGIAAEIISPDFETRTAILASKCKDKGFFLDNDSIHFVASIIQSNVRELEGALNKIIAVHQFKNIKPSLSTVKSILSTMVVNTNQNQSISPKAFIEAVANFYNLKFDDLIGKNKEQRVAMPRQIAMFLLRKDTNYSFPFIGQEVGGRDHTTVMHAYNKISKELEVNNRLREEIEMIKKRVYLVEKP